MTSQKTSDWLDGTERQFGTARNEINWPVVEELEAQLASLTPNKNYGFITGTERLSEFSHALQQHLEDGTATDFLTEIGQDLSKIYLVHAEVEDLDEPQKIKENAQAFQTELNDLKSKLPAVVFQEYQAELETIINTASILMEVGTPELTKQMFESGLYSQVYQVNQHNKTQPISIKYVNQCKSELASVARPKPPQWFDNLGQLLNKVGFTDQELEAVGLGGIDRKKVAVDFTIAAKLARAWLNRSKKFADWQVVAVDRATMSVNARGQEIYIPQTGVCTIDRLALLISHEGFHALRALNGAEQGFSFAQTGVENYSIDEEGGAALMELLLGQPHGHQRQLIIAARSYAINLALQTKRNQAGELVAKYSIQEIYDQLCNYNLDTIDSTRNVAAWIVERIFRGTSYQQQIVEVELDDQVAKVPEVVIKDAVYYTGVLELFEKLTACLPAIQQHPEIVQGVIDGEVELSSFAGLLGHQMAKDTGNVDYARDSQEFRQQVVDLGKDALMVLIQLLSIGKFRAEMVLTSDQWTQYLKVSPEEGIVQLSSMIYGD